jgi:hypothetical protein
MKINSFFAACIILGIISHFADLKSQDINECKVLIPELSGSYTGDCKNGLADGIGEAIGKEKYKGAFKKGYPHGKGIYYYDTGAVYEGFFNKGKRQGMGTLTYTKGDSIKVDEGLWEKDIFKGKKTEPPYQVVRKLNIPRYTFIKSAVSRNVVTIKIISNGSQAFPNDLLIYGSSGIMSQTTTLTGFENIQLPFSGNIKYTLLSPFNVVYVNYEMDFVINEPGCWEISLIH